MRIILNAVMISALIFSAANAAAKELTLADLANYNCQNLAEETDCPAEVIKERGNSEAAVRQFALAENSSLIVVSPDNTSPYNGGTYFYQLQGNKIYPLVYANNAGYDAQAKVISSSPAENAMREAGAVAYYKIDLAKHKTLNAGGYSWKRSKDGDMTYKDGNGKALADEPASKYYFEDM